jgi:peptide-methionine (S)-S-oxide reductase
VVIFIFLTKTAKSFYFLTQKVLKKLFILAFLGALTFTTKQTSEMALNKITLGGGCFWCIDSVFRRIRGVQSAISGYTGGHTQNPTYKEVTFKFFPKIRMTILTIKFHLKVCSGTTGHDEVVQVVFNPSVVSTEKILEVFFYIHDPTQLNGQGNDIGTQYRSAIFYHDTEQKSLAEKLIAELNASGKYKSKIVTEVTKLDKFYPAEDYHQDYFNQNPGQGYCQAVVSPKIEKFVKTYKDLLG